ncbi:MAG: glucose-6-phosphate dehydrogenase assembly protein OpcA [Treponema sp.]|jgi:hypothetical protein|nr:glucose-6-phosphate dehydrogenase assembly protein OpcA [Treponema sp.]
MLNAGILAPRRRSSWEAADAGLLLWKRNAGYFIPLFAIPFWLCAFALCFLPGLVQGGGVSVPALSLMPGGGGFLPGPWTYPLFWSWIVLWWLNPLFDRLILHVAAKRFFESDASLSGLFRGLGRSLGRGLAGDLLWRRLSPWRSAMLPLRILEQGAGGSRRRIRDRKRALSKGGIHFCIFITAWCFIFQWILLAGEILFVLMVLSIFTNPQIPGFGAFFAGKGLYCYAGWCVNTLVVESMYVCMGFGLYLNSRVEVEGWDIELLFRGFAGLRGGEH